jgi:hypothetical protein
MRQTGLRCRLKKGDVLNYKLNRLAPEMQRREKLITAAILSVLIIVIWCWYYERLSVAAWVMPIGYGGDGWLIFGTARAYMQGYINPFFPKIVPTLNAPFVANWNDYPITEDLIYAGVGWLGRLVGLFAAGNFALLLAHVLAGLSFWYVCRELKCRPAFAFAGGLVYAFCYFMIARGLGHLPLTFCWHVPLLLLVTGWVFGPADVPRGSARFRMAIAVSVLCGVLNPYYTGMYLQFLGFAVLMHLARKQYARAALSIWLIVLTFGAFGVMNADTIFYAISNGFNPAAAGRNLAALEVYGLKLPELLLPPGAHVIPGYEMFSQKHYYLKAFVKGEFWGPYLGLLPLVGLILMLGMSLYYLFRSQLARISLQFWLVLWILLYSLIGGVNLILGSFGFVLFRGTNRYSIFILACGLLFIIRLLSRKCPPRMVWPVVLALLVVGLGEPLGIRYIKSRIEPSSLVPVAAAVNADREFATSVERQVPGAMVFQLPVALFPEVPFINKMSDYEHLRPFLFTNTLHYSYGTNKGRGDDGWQYQAEKLPPDLMVAKLESYGFAVIMVNKQGYVDGAKALITALAARGKPVIAENNDLVAVRLSPSQLPIGLDPWPIYGPGWSSDEGTHRWSEANQVEILFKNSGSQAVNASVSFGLSALNRRSVTVSQDGQTLTKIELPVPGQEVAFPKAKLVLPPGTTRLKFTSPGEPVLAGNGDNRQLSFKLVDFQFLPAPR